MEIEKAFLLITLSLSVWTAFALLLDRRGHMQLNRGFAVLLLCFCIPQSYFYSRLIYLPHGSHLLGLAAQAVIWLKGPLLLGMVHLAVGQPLRRFAWHFVPFIIVLPLMAWTPEFALEWNMAGFVGLIVYLGISLRSLQSAKAFIKVIYSGYQNSAYYWMLFVVLGLLVLVGVDLFIMVLAYIQKQFWMEAIEIINGVVSVYLLLIAFFSIYRPTLFFNQDRTELVAEANQQSELVEQTLSGPDSTGKVWRELHESIAQELAVKLDSLMQDEQLYRKNDLSLAELAARLGVTIHQASELLNVHLNCNFYDYLNRYRIIYACQLLRDPNCQWRILDIAFESGFSNKNSFYRYFRETYHMTPVEYRNRHLGAELKVVS
ncbi:MAG: helix-turn-helix domain-containing protein [Cellvibrio sp.]